MRGRGPVKATTAVWSQSVIAETCTVNLTLIAAIMWLFVKWRLDEHGTVLVITSVFSGVPERASVAWEKSPIRGHDSQHMDVASHRTL